MKFKNRRQHKCASKQHRAKGHRVTFYLDDPEYELLGAQSADSGYPPDDCALALFLHQLYAAEARARMNEEKYGERFPAPEKCGLSPDLPSPLDEIFG